MKKNQQQQERDEFHQDSTMSMRKSLDRENILSLSFNQDGSCLAVGTTRGFRIYNVSPFRETFRREGGDKQNDHTSSTITNASSTSNMNTNTPPAAAVGTSGGIGIVEMLFRCNLLAIVGGGSFPQYPANKVMIYDDHQSKCIGELSFRQKVMAVKLRRDRIAAATSTKVYLYNFADLSLLDQIHTIANPRGLLALSPGSNTTLACPSIVRGHVRLELYSTRKSLLIEAHETELAALTLSMDGKLLGTASVKGTLIRVFDAQTGVKLHELRRGTERADIACIAFSTPIETATTSQTAASSSSSASHHYQWLATCSNKGTAHVFSLAQSVCNASACESGAYKHTLKSSSTNNNSKDNNINNGIGSSTSSTSGSLLGIPSAAYTWNSLSNAYSSAVSTMPSMMQNNKSYSQVRGLKDPKLCTFVQWPSSSNRSSNSISAKPPHLAIVGGDGSFWLVDFEKGGEAERLVYHSFFHDGAENVSVGGNAPHEFQVEACYGSIDDRTSSCDSVLEEGFVSIDGT
eukprot:CAMPEP_0116020772 /NCGR_PEP_ID=MMETSP0321-20121206/9996_1 /TAXON_ID=163516 /ORGANISM="Leptocylindrus danicus var. danicus, Strain B650" /LENGTH=517 /DNA_ID=CAMNT_0003491527 /DNA_START=296 /DNA_END=1849 /DNA_ORIENTATION=-